MIKVRLYTEEECIHASGIDTNGRREHVFDYESSFRAVLYNLCEDCERPFRDAESLKLLKDSYGITFISDVDWYTVLYDGERTCISEIEKELQFALMAVKYSRKGRYTWFRGIVRKEIWGILSDMPFDILIGWCIADIGIHSHSIDGADYSIINYPYRGKTVEVTVKNELYFNKDLYVRDLKPEGRTTSSRLWIGKEDGGYYIDKFEVKEALQYYWQHDIEGITEYIDKREKRIHLLEIKEEYDVFEFARKLGKGENEILWIDYLERLNFFYDGNEEAQEVKELQTTDIYKEYLYFRDTFKIISHIRTVPRDTMFRKLPILMADKNKDDSYRVHGALTNKNPQFHEALGQVIEERNLDGERIVLIIDKEELLDSVRDIDRAIYGFRVRPDSIEIFDVEDAIRLFGERLKEAHVSGKCETDYVFY